MRTRASELRGPRAQSTVVGVAVLLGATVVALGVLTAGVGGLVDEHAARSDAGRVATDLTDALRPVESTGHHSGRVSFTDGRIETVQRDLRVLDSDGTVATTAVDGLVFRHGNRRTAYVAGAVVRGHGENAWTVDPTPITGSESNGILVIGAAKLNASRSAVTGRDATVSLTTNVSHHRQRLGADEYRIAVETEAPAAFERSFEQRGASVTRRDFDGDGVASVVADFPGRRTAYLVEHDMRLRVNDA